MQMDMNPANMMNMMGGGNIQFPDNQNLYLQMMLANAMTNG